MKKIFFVILIVLFSVWIGCGNNPLETTKETNGHELINKQGPGQGVTLPIKYIITDENYNQFVIEGYGSLYQNDNKEDLFHIYTEGCGITITEFSKKKSLQIILK